MLTQEQQQTIDSMRESNIGKEWIDSLRRFYMNENARTPEERERHRKRVMRNSEPQPPDAILYAPEEQES
jgi:hypothetical protein